MRRPCAARGVPVCPPSAPSHAYRPRCGDRTLAEKLTGSLEPLQPLSRHAIVAAQALVSEAGEEYETAASGFADAAARWHDFGVPYEEGQALLGQGRCLAALGRASEATAPLNVAHEIFARPGASPRW